MIILSIISLFSQGSHPQTQSILKDTQLVWETLTQCMINEQVLSLAMKIQNSLSLIKGKFQMEAQKLRKHTLLMLFIIISNSIKMKMEN